MPEVRHFLVKIYDQDGSTFRKTFSSDRPEGALTGYIKAPLSFKSQLNGGQGQLQLDIALPFDDFDEGSSIAHMNIVRVYSVVIDTLTQTETLVYSGFISRYEPYAQAGGEEGVRVTCLGLVSLLALSYYKSGSSFTVTHTTQDPSDIVEDIVDHFNTVYGGSLLSYTADSLQTVGTNVSLTFTDQRWSDAIKKARDATSQYWWWYVDQDGLVSLKQKPSTPTHTFTIGRDVESITAPKDAEKIVNDVQVRRSGGTATDYSDATSQSTYGTGSPATGKRTQIITDSTITDATTADQVGNKAVGDNKDAKIKATVVVNSKYAIDSVRPGDTCAILNVSGSFFSSNMLIVAVTYNGTTVTLELEEQPANFGRELTGLISSSTPASSGGGGGGASVTFVDKETPSGSVDGSNVTFTLANTPTAGSEHFWVDGTLQKPGGVDYTISGGTITCTYPPHVGAVLLCSYRR